MPKALTASIRLAILVTLSVGVSNVLTAQPRPGNSHAADGAAIRAARIAQNRAIVAGNTDSVATFWTDDVIIRRGLGQAVVGRAAYRALFAADKPGSSLVYQRQSTSVEVSSHWPLAFETGTWVGHTGTATGPAAIRGRFSAQWVKRDGRWLIRAEVFVALECAGEGCAAAAAP